MALGGVVMSITGARWHGESGHGWEHLLRGRMVESSMRLYNKWRSKALAPA